MRVGIYSTATHVNEDDLSAALRSSAEGSGWELVGGTRAHFTELNRNHSRLPRLDGLSFSVTPQVHVHETAQLVESVPVQNLIARQAAVIADGAPIHVGPVTLRPRFNAVRTSPAPHALDGIAHGYGAQLIPDATDPRQTAEELAAWVIASAASLLSVNAVASISFFEQWGPRGLSDADGAVYPAAAAFEALAQLVDRPLLVQRGIRSGQRIFALGAVRSDEVVVLLANLTSQKQTVQLAVHGREASVTLNAFAFRQVQL